MGDNFTAVLINNGLLTQNDTVDDDIEANLDVQYALSLSYPTPSFYYSTGGLGELVPDLDQPDPSDDQNEPYLDFLSYIMSLPDYKLPTTLTTSYGEDEQSVPEACKLFNGAVHSAISLTIGKCRYESHMSHVRPTGRAWGFSAFLKW